MDIIDNIDKVLRPAIDFILEYWVWMLIAPFLLLILWVLQLLGILQF